MMQLNIKNCVSKKNKKKNKEADASLNVKLIITYCVDRSVVRLTSVNTILRI